MKVNSTSSRKSVSVDIYCTAWKVCKCGVFSGRIFPRSDWIRRDTEYLYVLSPNAGKYGPEKTPYLDTFHAVLKLYSQRRIQSAMKHLRWSFLWKQLVAYSCYLFSQKALSEYLTGLWIRRWLEKSYNQNTHMHIFKLRILLLCCSVSVIQTSIISTETIFRSKGASQCLHVSKF